MIFRQPMWKGTVGMVTCYGGQGRHYASFSGRKDHYIYTDINYWISGCGPFQRGRVFSELDSNYANSEQGARFI